MPITADEGSQPVDLAREPDFLLGSLKVCPSSREVVGAGQREVVEPRVMQVLVALARRRGQVVSRDQLIETLFARGIGCSVHYIPLHQQPYWRDRYGLTPTMFPHSQRVFETQLSLPIYTRMSDADVQLVIDAVLDAVKATAS